MKKRNLLLFSIFLIGCGSFGKIAFAQEPRFIFPAGCTYGQNCWAVNYVDVDGKGGTWQDFKCGPKSYDMHKGTDFALSSISQMKSGVDVFAAADGRVLRFRDGESDRLKSEEEMQDIQDGQKECGNGILIDHGNGLQTIYCHLKKGSVVVEAKQKVKAGQKIGQVGQSGMAEFPHLHFGVLWEGGVVDPYTGVLNTEGCNKMKESLWHEGLPMIYEPFVIFDGGFRNTSPDFEAIKRGEESPDQLPLNSAAFVFWTGFYNVEEGDNVLLEIRDPDGALFVDTKETLDKNRARQYYFTGRKIGRVQLKSGTYTGHAKITRAGKNGEAEIVREKSFSVEVK